MTWQCFRLLVPLLLGPLELVVQVLDAVRPLVHRGHPGSEAGGVPLLDGHRHLLEGEGDDLGRVLPVGPGHRPGDTFDLLVGRS